ncbi:hypothetical protein N2152v2_005315 [Parachlorella kessleri]
MTRAQTGRPKGSKNKPKDGAAATQPAQPSGQASKKRSAAGAPVAAAAAAAPSDGGEQPHVSELEGQRQRLAKELTAVEARIYHLETQYLENSSPFGNAIRGYEGFLGGAAAANRKVVVKPEDRLFSWSSITGQTMAHQR